MGNTSVPKFIFRLYRFPVYRGSGLGRFYCIYYSWHFDGIKLYTGKDLLGIEDRLDVFVEIYTAAWQHTIFYSYLMKAPS
jgi:hypothetical protein